MMMSLFVAHYPKLCLDDHSFISFVLCEYIGTGNKLSHCEKGTFKIISELCIGQGRIKNFG